MGGTTQSNREGLLAGALESPLLNLGAGLLAASGPSTTPVSFGQALGSGVQFAQNAQQQNLRNQLVRSRLQDDSRRRSAVQQLGGLLGQDNTQLGLLADIAPGAVAQGLISQQFQTRRPDSVLSRLQAAGIDPQSEQGRALITQSIGGSGEALDQALKVIQIQQAQTKAESARTENQRTEGRREFVVRSSLDKIEELRALNQKRRSFLANPAAALSIDGVNTVQRFNQLTTELVLKGALDPLRDVGNRLTDSGRRALFQSKITGSTTPDVADQILTDMEKGLREAGSIIGLRDISTPSGPAAPRATPPQAAAGQTPQRQGRIFTNANALPKSQRRIGDVFNSPDGRTFQWRRRNGRLGWDPVE